MKEQKLIMMYNRVEKLGALMEGVLMELSNLRDLSVGTLETLKKMPGYEKAINKLKEEIKEEIKDKKDVE
jgi:fatty acid-binding protein DegV